MTSPTVAPIRSLVSAVKATRSVSRDDILEGIEGITVEIINAEIEHIVGRWSEYDLATVVLADGRSFRVAGKAVCEPLSEVNFADGPITATFRRVESAYQPGSTYWTVE